VIAAPRFRFEPYKAPPVSKTPLTAAPNHGSTVARRSELTDVLAHSRLPGLDGLRAVGVLGVVLAHATFARGLPGDFGPTGFFVLSGFLITRILLREHNKHGKVSLRRFYLARTLRIFPAYYAFVLLSYLLDARAGQAWTPGFLTSGLTYTINYFNAFNHHPTTSLAHVWSLADEEQFYLLWPLAFGFLAARNRRALVTGLIMAALAVVSWRCWLILGAHVDASYVYNAFDTRFDNLAIGCMLAVAVEHNRVLDIGRRIGGRSWYLIITIVLLLVSHDLMSSTYHYSIGFTIDALLIAIAIVQVIQVHGSRLWSWLEWPVLRYIGAISYPMYLYHAWGLSLGRRMPGDFLLLDFLAGVVATILLASASYHFLELPILKKLRARRAPEVSSNVAALTIPEPSGVLAPTV
jgi:peptidoglycan/LPS O-acetylase OafA/YrhL